MVANAGIITPLASIVDGAWADVENNVMFKLVTAKIEDWDKVWSVNIRGVALCYKHAAIQMIKQGAGGRIIGDFPAFRRAIR